MPEVWTLHRGATVEADGSVRFVVWAPAASRITVRLPGRAGPVELPLAADPDGSGVHQASVADVAPGTDYRFCLDGARDRPDPVSRHQPEGVHGPSRVVAPRDFPWTDAGWSGFGPDPVFYEIHVGTFTEAGTFEAAAERLPYLRDLGVTAIELMPVSEFPGGRNWGYDGVCPYAPQSSYGGPDSLRRLVDAAHAHGIAVLLDVVYNHLGPEGNYLPEFGPYFTDRYRTPWGSALNFDGPHSDEVRRYVIDNARYWIAEYHLDGLRLDAVHQIFDLSARHVLEELTAEVHALAAALGRRVLVVAESDLNDPRVVREAGRGGLGFDAQWADDFHHAVHATLTGERAGYYADFGGGVEQVAKALRDRFVLDGGYSTFRRRRHGAPATGLPAEKLVVSIQNHDQVGNRARGDRLGSLVPFGARKTAAALLLLSPYLPLLFMGEEYGETRPFLYFVSHGDPDLIEAVRRGRRQEFATFGWPGEVPDPEAPATFEESRLSWRADVEAAQLLALYRDLIAERRAVRSAGGAALVGCDPAAGWVSLGHPGWMAAFNLVSGPVSVVLPAGPGRWTVAFTTEDQRYGGGGMPRAGGPADDPLGLPGFSAALLRSVAD